MEYQLTASVLRQALGQPTQPAAARIGPPPTPSSVTRTRRQAGHRAEPDPGRSRMLQRVRDRLGRGEPDRDGNVAASASVTRRVLPGPSFTAA